MDKYEFKIKADQITKLVERKDYKTAAKIADGIDWRRVRNVELLLKVTVLFRPGKLGCALTVKFSVVKWLRLGKMLLNWTKRREPTKNSCLQNMNS